MLLILLLITILGINQSFGAISAREGQVIAQCLQRYGGMNMENANRLQRYKEWADNYEEFPCFTNCYLNKLGNLYKESSGFNEDAVRREFGDAVYTTCKSRLLDGRDSCDIAYNGFHCLITLQDDPFMLIESDQHLPTDTKSVMKDCLRQFDQQVWAHIKDYLSTPVNEPIPCFTKCFVDTLGLLNNKTRHWNIAEMQSKLNVPRGNADISHCQTLMRRRKRKPCIWVYKELVCYMKASQNIPF